MSYTFVEGAEGVGWGLLSCTWLLLSQANSVKTAAVQIPFGILPCPLYAFHPDLAETAWRARRFNLVSMSILSLALFLRQLATEIF